MHFSTTRFSVLFGCFFWSGLLVSIIHAEDIYIAQTARGSDTGANSANAHSIAWFNTSGNWDTDAAADGKIGPGDTVHLTGTISSSIDVQGSGTAGNRITIKMDPGAKFSAPVWPATGAIHSSNKSHLTFEGGNPQAGRGIKTQTDIEATANGTGLANQREDTRGLFTDGTGTNITLRNFVVENIYVRTFQHPTDISGGGTGASIRGGSDLVIENCYFKNAETGCNVVGNLPLNERLYIQNNWITDCSDGIKISCGGSNVIVKDSKVIRNRINNNDRWGGVAAGGYHNDGIQTIGDPPGSSFRNLHVAYNHIGPNLSTDGSMTSPIFLAHGNTGGKIYNNYIEYAPGHNSTNPAINVGNSPVEEGLAYAERHLICNNTIRGGAASYGIHGGFAEIVGNVVTNMGGYTDIHNLNTGNPALNTLVNRNCYFGAAGDFFYIRSGPGTGTISSLSTWRGFGFDAQGIIADPKLNSNGTLQAGSPAIDMAPSQSAIFTDDFFGNQRTGAWDAGAFEFGATGGGGSAPTPTPTPASTPTPSPSPASTPTSSPSPAPTSAPSPASTPAASGANVALAANGGVASASSTISSNYAVNGVNNGERRGIGWAAGSGGWNDATEQVYPDWVEITFSGPKTINEVDVFTLQDHPGATPTESMTFGEHGITDFDVQYWNGSAWVNVPGGQITGNNRVWRKLTFSGISTSKIRVVVNKALAGYSRIVEIEAYSSSGVPAPTPAPTSSPSPTPTSGIPTVGESFAADSVEPTFPFGATNGYVSQPSGTSLEEGGSAVYKFTVPDHGEYAVVFEVDAAHTGSNSLYLNVDADPQDPVMVWDIPVTTGFQARVASWRGGGTFDANQFVPKYFLLSPGEHDLVVRGREGNTKFKTITILKRPALPNDLVIP